MTGSGAGAAGIDKPIFCNGANLMFKKQTYMNLQDPLLKKTASGDDTFLLHKIKKKYSGRIKFLKSIEATVKTQGAGKINDFFQQRVRWTSKSRYYKDFDLIMTACIVFLTNLTILYWYIMFFITGSLFFLFFYSVKTSIDGIFLWPVLKFYKKSRLFYLVPLVQLLYPVYIVFTVISASFLSFKWKGRRY